MIQSQHPSYLEKSGSNPRLKISMARHVSLEINSNFS